MDAANTRRESRDPGVEQQPAGSHTVAQFHRPLVAKFYGSGGHVHSQAGIWACRHSHVTGVLGAQEEIVEKLSVAVLRQRRWCSWPVDAEGCRGATNDVDAGGYKDVPRGGLGGIGRHA